MTVEPSGTVRVATGVGTQGQGHFTVLRADRRRRARRGRRRRAGRHRRHARVPLGHRHVRQPRRGGRRQRVPCGRARRCARRFSRSPAQLLGAPADAARARRRARVGRGATGRGASRSASWPRKANPLRGAVRPGTEPGLESTAYFGPDRGSTASGVHAMIVEVDPETADGEDQALRRRPRLRHA